MLVLDFINVGNGDAILVREMEGKRQVFAMLVDCGHDRLERDDHPPVTDPRSCRIYAGDFLRKNGVTHLDLLLLTHFHRDHIGGLGRVLEAVTVGELVSTYCPPEGAEMPVPDPMLPKAAKNLLACVKMYTESLRQNPGRVQTQTVLTGERTVARQLTKDLRMELFFGDPVLYSRQRSLYDGAFRGIWDGYELVHWAKLMNISSLRQRLYYHGKEIVLGGDCYGPFWETETSTPCDLLKVPHHASASSVTRKLLRMLRPKTAVVCTAAGRPDERPHPYIVSLLQEMVPHLYFTDAVDIPGLVKPVFHESVHLTIP